MGILQQHQGKTRKIPAGSLFFPEILTTVRGFDFFQRKPAAAGKRMFDIVDTMQTKPGLSVCKSEGKLFDLFFSPQHF